MISEPLKNGVAARCVGCLFGDVVDGGLFDSGVKDGCPGIVGVEGPALDPSNGEICQALKREAFEV